ncbi:MAG TPA: L-histidine N(alpha)-methyltransferase [Flexivirga sp.]|uniref:L-histidine N(alpha)-methyltransferase n=1 Tax=Flexivirga sp. TaxID=1962927 RepID=UPI002C9461E6|nr:L-histidine N(alpha)-methyltransferase [Flexivirga sp.]HWC22102.1 L-histidine N(alpha)-methyltransferase [Flexivirga sp.]
MSPRPEPVVSVLLDPDRAGDSLIEDVRRGLGSQPRTISPKWLYDDRGSELFDQITKLPDYYPFAAEHEILSDFAPQIAAASGASTLIELGSGTSEKSRILLDAFTATGRLRRFTPVDVSEATLRQATETLAERYPGLRVEAVVGDFTLHLAQLPAGDRRTIAFLGSTIGNLYREERAAFLGALSDVLVAGDSLLLGVDLVKSADRLVAAYNDPDGVTEDFVRNVLHVLNHALGSEIDVDGFAYVPFWDPHMERMDLRLRAEMPQRVRLPGAGLDFTLASGEEVRVEISTKFRISGISGELEDVGLPVRQVWTDRAGDFAVLLAAKPTG